MHEHWVYDESNAEELYVCWPFVSQRYVSYLSDRTVCAEFCGYITVDGRD